MTRPPTIRSGAHVTIVEGKGVVRIDQQYRFAFGLKNAARVLANRARETAEADGHEMRAFVTGAVSLSYSYLEAAFNEFLYLNALSTASPLSDSERAVLRAIGTEHLRPRGGPHVLELFNLALRLLNKKELARGEQPYQAANAVRALRNLLVHSMPGSVITYTDDPDHDLSQQQEIVKQLKSHLNLGRRATFPHDILTASCAAWAVRSCEAFFHDFSQRSGVNPGFITE